MKLPEKWWNGTKTTGVVCRHDVPGDGDDIEVYVYIGLLGT